MFFGKDSSVLFFYRNLLTEFWVLKYLGNCVSFTLVNMYLVVYFPGGVKLKNVLSRHLNTFRTWAVAFPVFNSASFIFNFRLAFYGYMNIFSSYFAVRKHNTEKPKYSVISDTSIKDAVIKWNYRNCVEG